MFWVCSCFYMGPIFTNVSVGSTADRWTHCSSSAFPWNCLFHGVTLFVPVSASIWKAALRRARVILLISVDVLLPDIFCRTSSPILFFPWSLGYEFPLGLFCPHPFQPCFLGSQQAVPFGVWFLSWTVPSSFLSNLVSWGVSKLFLLGYGFSPGLFCPHSYPTMFPGESASCSFWGMDFLDLSRISVAPSLSCKYSLFYFQVSGGAFAGTRISVAPSLSCK